MVYGFNPYCRAINKNGWRRYILPFPANHYDYVILKVFFFTTMASSIRHLRW